MGPLRDLVFSAIVWAILILLIVGIPLFPIYLFLILRGAEARRQNAEKKLEDTLMEHEKVLAKTMQLRICSITSRRTLVAVTNSRIILITRPLFGGFSMRDYQWKDLHDAQWSENIVSVFFGSKLTFSLRKGGWIAVDGVPNDEARDIYKRAQAEEQTWEEKHRVRALEERRAASGAISFQAGGAPGASSQGGGSSGISALDELEKAKQLYDAQAISDAEYQEIKAKILSRHGGAVL